MRKRSSKESLALRHHSNDPAHAARRPRLPLLAVALASLPLLAGPAAPVAAQEDEEGGSASLSEAIGAYLDAQDELAALEAEQEALEQELADSEAEVTELETELGEYAYIAYTASDLQSTAALMATGNPSDAIDAMSTLQFLGESRADRLNELIVRLDEIEAMRSTLEDNIAEQEDAARDEAAREMAASGGDDAVGPTPGDFPDPEDAARDGDGTLPSEGCSEEDPTTGGCVSPRTLHALEQIQIAGFTRYVKCYRPDTSGEHPKGKACDLAAQPGGFGGVASGDDFTYGENLAAWLVENADDLGVRYVIWYERIWQPATGWRTYNLGSGDPNSDHTNHVHLSMR
jgi:septal ring factor EnvC (AmiA/AmiB activator)